MKLTSKTYSLENTDTAISFCLEKGWTDGLPVIPPTPDKVSQFLEYTNRSPSEIVGHEPVKGKPVSIEKIAINSVMAGCLPEYFPVVLTAIEAVLEPEFNLHGITASTMGAAVLTVISGPVVKTLDLNGGISLFGPGHRANATIGRAIRLVLTNVTRARSGEIDKATMGHAGKYTWCIAENSDKSPWTSLGEDRGYSKDSNSLTVFAGLSPIQVSNHSSSEPNEILASFKDAIFAAGSGHGELLIVLCPEHVHNISKSGWGKSEIRDYLYNVSTRSNIAWAKGSNPPGELPTGNTSSPATLGPEGFTILVAGGAAGAFSNVIPLWAKGVGSQSVSKRINLS